MNTELKEAIGKLDPDDPLITILRLHGDTTAGLLEKTSFKQGEPPAGIAVGLWVPPHIDSLLDRVIDIQNLFNIDDTFEVRKEKLNLKKEKYEEIMAEAMEMSDNDFDLFDRLHAVRILETVLENLKSLPTYHDALISNNQSKLLSEFVFSIKKQLFLCGFLQGFDCYANGKGEVGKIMAANFYHDAFGPYCALRDIPDFMSKSPDCFNDTELLVELCYAMEDLRKFVTQTLEANLAIAKSKYELKPFSPNHEFYSLLRMLSSRFKLTLTEKRSSFPTENKQIIKLIVEENTVCTGDSSAIALVLYNIVKNPLKVASFSRKEIPSVDISIGNSIGGLCTSIFIRDTGLGFSFDDLTKKFTKEAFTKLERGESLQFVEECLIDEAMCDHVPPKAMADHLCNRGASFAGGTGIGLALAKDIIENGHQGAVRLYNHPSMGAGVQILLPNTDNSFSPKERRQITRWTLQEQMKQGLSPAISSL